jgi:hypothetical protein
MVSNLNYESKKIVRVKNLAIRNRKNRQVTKKGSHYKK